MKTLRLFSIRRRSLWAALLVALGFGTLSAQAQIAREKPGKVKAVNRRALREAKRVEAPYKDTHLQVTRAQLKRGKSDQPAPAGSDELRFRNGTRTTAKGSGFLGMSRKKKL